jgi:hypothetical protein
MPTHGQELSSIDFSSMIGGPLVAVVQAQAQSALATVNFIKQVGFEQPAGTAEQPPDAQITGKPIYVKFRYQKDVPALPAAGDGGTTTPAPTKQTYELEVPILTMLPIPYLRVEETTIAFNAKINSVEYARTDSSVAVDAALEARAGWGWGSARLKVSASYKSSTTTGNSVERTYSLAVNVKAVQDELPGGMEKLLSILENSITTSAVPATT